MIPVTENRAERPEILNEVENILSGAVELRGVGIRFEAAEGAVEALRDFDLQIAPGEFVSILGPSGCGKSTLIGAVAGLTPFSSGEIRVDGLPVLRPGPERGVVFQQSALFPWKTVLGNVAFGLKMRGEGKGESRAKAHRILAEVGLDEFAGHYPSQLSGGMQQRVNLARALVNRPRVLLMDEPFSSLDAQTRLQMQELLLDLWQALRMTVIFVTHDVDEALFLGDRVAVISRRPGRVREEIPVDLRRPRTIDFLTSREFVTLKRRCIALLRAESDGPQKKPADRQTGRIFGSGETIFSPADASQFVECKGKFGRDE
jgi:NitT/TauT family transport system ATP-binding protein